MGQIEYSNSIKGITKPTRDMFEFLEVLGQGGFGKVYKVNYKKTKKILALKQMNKIKLLQEDMVNDIFNERNMLSHLYTNHIANLYCTFQDEENVYMVLDYIPGCDLREHINEKFTEEQIKFFAANITIGLEFIHSANIIHRDIKPENLLFDEKGYLIITDFGLAVKKDTDLSNDTGGTPRYMAPERVYDRKYIGFESDYFSLGVVLYEMILKKYPFKEKIYEKMIKEFDEVEINLTQNDCPGYSYQLCDFINKLLIKEPSLRLGYNGANEVRNHPFLDELNFVWNHIYHKTWRSPYKINLEKELKITKKAKKKEKIIDEKTQQKRNSSFDDEVPFLDYEELSKTKFQNFTMILQINPSYYTTPYQGRNNRLHKKSKTIKLKYKINFDELKDESTFLKSNEINETSIINLPDINTNKIKTSNLKKLKGNKSCIQTEKKNIKLPQIKKVLFKKEINNANKINKISINADKKRAKTNIRSNYLDNNNNNKIVNKTSFNLNKSN